uniref:WWE domain-containing protein n=1 Tax=Panagrellus redivivus TaxID=6233 RepID=A0A7E4US74_PANRE
MSNDTIFTGWDLVFQATERGNWRNSLRFIKSNPTIEDLAAGHKQRNYYLCRPGFLPIWEDYRYYGMVYSQKYYINNNELIQMVQRFMRDPMSQDENVVIVRCSPTKQTFKLWITGDEMDAERLKNAFTYISDGNVVKVRPVFDTTWTNNTGFPVKRKTFNNFNDPSLCILSISHEAASAYAVAKIFEALVFHDPICKPIRAGNELRPGPNFLLELYIDPKERGQTFQKFETDEFLVLLVAEWKRRVLKVCDMKRGFRFVCSENDSDRTFMFEV